MCSASCSTEEPLADHHLVDRLLEQLGEAGHVNALLGGVEVDVAVDLRRDQGVPAAVAHSHRPLDAGHTGPREPDPDIPAWTPGVELLRQSLAHAANVAAPWPTNALRANSAGLDE